MLTLFVGDGDESKQAINALKGSEERFRTFDVRELNMVKGDEITPPTLYAPEGTFIGWREIQIFVRIPRDMRLKHSE